MRKLLLLLAFASAAYADKPETVITTYYPKSGKDVEMVRVLRDAWTVYTKLHLVTGAHQLYRAQTEGGTVYFVAFDPVVKRIDHPIEGIVDGVRRTRAECGGAQGVGRDACEHGQARVRGDHADR